MTPVAAGGHQEGRARTGRRSPARRSRAAGRAVVPRTRVRTATAGDAGVVTALRRALRHEEHGTVAPARAPRATSPAGSVRQVTFLAEREGRAVGILRCTTRHSSTGRLAWVSAVYVRPGVRRRGVLRALLAAAESWCRRQGLAEMRLHCAVQNAVGNAAWTALGFAPSKVLYRRAVPGG